MPTTHTINGKSYPALLWPRNAADTLKIVPKAFPEDASATCGYLRFEWEKGVPQMGRARRIAGRYIHCADCRVINVPLSLCHKIRVMTRMFEENYPGRKADAGDLEVTIVREKGHYSSRYNVSVALANPAMTAMSVPPPNAELHCSDFEREIKYDKAFLDDVAKVFSF